MANFWQDVARDLDIGRVYLPAEDRHRFGYSEADLQARRFTPAFAELMRFEVAGRGSCSPTGLPLVPLVPADVRMDIELFLRGGLGILGKIEGVGYNVWQTRPVLNKRKNCGCWPTCSGLGCEMCCGSVLITLRVMFAAGDCR